VDEYCVGPYRIDIYIPKQRIAIEIDEHGHENYDQNKEKEREEYIKKTLKAKIYRLNPHKSNLRWSSVFGEIRRLCIQ
jgi:very-short-patch-repair endonuclease